MRKRLWISEPNNIHNNYGLQLYYPDENEEKASAVLNTFELLCMRYFNEKSFGMFFQGGHGSNTWRYFEFWCSPSLIGNIIDVADKISKELNMELEI